MLWLAQFSEAKNILGVLLSMVLYPSFVAIYVAVQLARENDWDVFKKLEYGRLRPDGTRMDGMWFVGCRICTATCAKCAGDMHVALAGLQRSAWPHPSCLSSLPSSLCGSFLNPRRC